MSSSELELCFERRMRWKAEALSEALAAELANERRRCETAEAECRAIRENDAAAREEVESTMEDVEEERRMLRVVELWREECVQIKLADARAAMEEKLREIDDAIADIHATTAASNNHKSSCCCSSSSPNGKTSSPTRVRCSGARPAAVRTRTSGGGWGVKGFVEFPMTVRVRPHIQRRPFGVGDDARLGAAVGDIATGTGMR
nr:unnamed protein product [Digitaria exilis]